MQIQSKYWAVLLSSRSEPGRNVSTRSSFKCNKEKLSLKLAKCLVGLVLLYPPEEVSDLISGNERVFEETSVTSGSSSLVWSIV